MSRTAHHVPPSHAHTRATDDERRPGAPWHALLLHDLRYDAACLDAALREGRRPVPRAVRRRVEVYAFPRHNRDRSLPAWATREERRARRRLRGRVGVLLRLLHSPTGPLRPYAAGTVDIPPARHRRGALWLA
ncbi:hypothetical protein ACFY7C_34260 [Streptomyces sp. NPDC012769]|uniref:hypothetical protein n=1 Tax=Streptomyces sp. NPDC012769 TaxID=3364848 RepID=UPI003676A96F